ncbi:MAG: ADP-ribosylglycohydrolase family protein [Candidatus Hadarchaeales archaeon]
MDLLEKFRGCMLGVAVGDGLGRPFEGSCPVDPNMVEETAENAAMLYYTDDTEMTLNLAKSLVERGELDLRHVSKSFASNFNPMRGYGPNTLYILQRIKEGEEWRQLAEKSMGGEGSFGNGAAMRVAPLALLFRGEEMIQAVRECSRVTHTHPAGIEGAVLQATGIHLALHSEPGSFNPPQFLEELGAVLTSEIFREKLERVKKLLLEPPLQSKIIQELGNGIEAFNSVPTALYCFLSSSSFREGVLKAVSLGGDADTIGSMTGALLGALLGAKAIPSKWATKIEGREEIENLASKLFFLFVKRELEECEFCLGQEELEVVKIDPCGEMCLENLMLICKHCRKELAKGVRLAPKKKRGKYRAVYRRSYRRGID